MCTAFGYSRNEGGLTFTTVTSTTSQPLIRDASAPTSQTWQLRHGEQLADALVERFADRTRLSLEPDEAEADLVVRATVERYTVAPAAVTGDEVAALNRVTLGVRVVATNRLDESDLLDRAFTATADYAPAEGLAGESDAAQRALEQIAQDAFTAATSDW